MGSGFHLQAKLGAVDLNNVMPWDKKGNDLDDCLQVARWCEAAGVDAIHVSTGMSFPHPLNPPGDLPLDVLATTYDTMISSGDWGDAQLPVVPLSLVAADLPLDLVPHEEGRAHRGHHPRKFLSPRAAS